MVNKKHCSDPWLEFIQSGKKKFEGRLNVGWWKKIKIGNKIQFHNELRAVLIKIIKIYTYTNFGEAFIIHGQEDQLINVSHATRLYQLVPEEYKYKLWIVPRADHNNVVFYAGNAYYRELNAFLNST